uniref:Uncharacterized protein n=1 Tax=Arundo donax TaxID=35708 RepID=A0A0A9C1Q1_ARUDO
MARRRQHDLARCPPAHPPAAVAATFHPGQKNEAPPHSLPRSGPSTGSPLLRRSAKEKGLEALESLESLLPSSDEATGEVR